MKRLILLFALVLACVAPQATKVEASSNPCYDQGVCYVNHVWTQEVRYFLTHMQVPQMVCDTVRGDNCQDVRTFMRVIGPSTDCLSFGSICSVSAGTAYTNTCFDTSCASIRNQGEDYYYNNQAPDGSTTDYFVKSVPPIDYFNTVEVSIGRVGTGCQIPVILYTNDSAPWFFSAKVNNCFQQNSFFAAPIEQEQLQSQAYGTQTAITGGYPSTLFTDNYVYPVSSEDGNYETTTPAFTTNYAETNPFQDVWLTTPGNSQVGGTLGIGLAF